MQWMSPISSQEFPQERCIRRVTPQRSDSRSLTGSWVDYARLKKNERYVLISEVIWDLSRHPNLLLEHGLQRSHSRSQLMPAIMLRADLLAGAQPENAPAI